MGKLKGVKNIFIAVVTALVFVGGFDGFNCVSAKTSIGLDTARNVAKSKLYWYPEWAGAEIGSATVYFDLKDNPSAYIFKVVKDNKTLGYISISATQDYFPIIEFALGSIIPSDLVNRCREIALSKTSGKLGQPKFLYLGGIDYLVSFQIEGTEESITIGLKSGIIYSKEVLRWLQDKFDSRSKEQALSAEKSWKEVKSKKASRQPPSGKQGEFPGVERYTFYRGSPPPCGAMILNYYGTSTSPLGSYTKLYYTPGTFSWRYPGTQNLTSCYGPRRLMDQLADYCDVPYQGGTWTDYLTDKISDAIKSVTQDHGYIFETTVLKPAGSTQYVDKFKAEINANRPFIVGFGEEKISPDLFVYAVAYGYRYPSEFYHYLKVYTPYEGGCWNSEILLENQWGVFAVLVIPPPVDTEPDKINVYHYQEPVTRQLTYPIPLFKQGSNVYVTVSDGTTTGLSLVEADIYVTQLSHKSTVTVNVRDDGTGYDMRAYDGIYTGMFNFDDSVGLGNGEKGIITANLNKGTMYGSFTIIAEYIPPAFINPPAVSKYIFSPNVLPGTTTISFTAHDDIADGTWTYAITIDNGIEPSGIGATGTCKGSTSITFDWNGEDKSGSLLRDGSHTIMVVIGDLAENFETKTTQVIIDTTPPIIEDAKLLDYYFSPPAPKGTTTISFTGSDTYGTWSYTLQVGTRTLCGSATPTGTRTSKSQVVFDWNGKVQTESGELLLGEGIYTITILLTDFMGNTSSTSLLAKIDKTNPQISQLSVSRYIFSPKGIYPETTISFTGGDNDCPWQFSILVDGQIPGGTGASSGTRTVGTSNINFIWNGSPLTEGTHTVLVSITDFAGNLVNTSTTVIIDTTKPTIANFYASDYYFSPPEPPQATVSITFTGNDDRGTWSYALKVDGYTPDGVGTSADTCFGSQTITFIWDGSPLGEGTHTFVINLTDFAGNINSATLQICIDNTPPTIGTLTASDYYISHTGEDKTTIISFYGNDDRNTWMYNLMIGTRSLGGDTPYGTRTGSSKVEFRWNGKDNQGLPFNEGENVIVVTITDLAGNTITKTISIFIDNTPPQVSTLTSTSYYFSPVAGKGTPTLIFTAKDEYENWYYEFRISGKIPGGVPSATGTSEFREAIISFTWNGRDINGHSYWEDTHIVIITVKDGSGNISTRSTTIAIDNTPPKLVNFNVTPPSFSYRGIPNIATITFTAEDNESGTWSYKITITERGKEVTPAGTGNVMGVSGQKQTIVFLWNGYYKENGNEFPCSDGSHNVKVVIEDLANNSIVRSITVDMESTKPSIFDEKITRFIISPNSEFSEYRYTQITFKATDNAKTWKYQLSIGTLTSVIEWTGLAPDTFTSEGTKTISFTWDGKVNVNGIKTLEDGIYFLNLTVYDKMNNTDSKIFPIIIDTTPPRITEVTNDTYDITQYQGEQILFTLKSDEIGSGTILLGTTSLQSAEEVITGDKGISLNEGFAQFERGYPGGKIEIFIIKRSSPEIKSYQFKIENYTKLNDLINDINSTISPIASITYSTSLDKFTIQCIPDYRIAFREYDIEAFHVGFFSAIKLPIGYVELPITEITQTEYKGYYKVPNMSCASKFDVFGRFLDAASNWASNNGTYTGSILLDGSQKVPVGKSRIVGIRIDPAPSNMMFNTEKTQLTLSMIVAEVKQNLSAIQDPIIKYGTYSATIYHPNIKKDMQVIVWCDYIRDTNNNIINNHARVWRVIAQDPGTITISNNSLYFGKPIGTYSHSQIPASYIHIIDGTFTTMGMTLVDVGIVQTGIKLYDDGDIDYHRDEVANDGIYTGIYNVPNNIETKDVPIVCHYIGPNGERVLNDGYPFNDEEKLPFSYPEYDTDIFNNVFISIDTVRPKVIVLGVDTPFNPFKDRKAEIKYRLEKSIVATVRILIKADEKLIKDLGFHHAVQGDNVVYWDGKDELGNIVEDGTYRFYIDARDDAGNTPEELVFSSIKVTSVEIKIDELTVDISKPTLQGDKLVIDHLTIGIKAKLEASMSQLENLEFKFIPYSKNPIYDIYLYNKPYALFYITLHDSTGKIIQIPDHDWSYLEGGIDTDPHLFDLPNYYIRPEEREPVEDVKTILEHYPLPDPPGGSLSEYGDGDKFNDWDTLKPFNRDKLEDLEGRNYTAEFRGTILGLEIPQGTYYVRVFAKLVAGDWGFVDHKKDKVGNIIGEMWHFEPDYYHYGLISNPREQRFEVIREDYPETDHTPPEIYESFPADGQVVAPGEVKSGEDDMNYVISVRVSDSETGVDFENSKIELKDSKNRIVDGQPKHNGIDKLYWILNKNMFPNGLITPGEYSIYIRVLDKAANEKTEVRKFTVEDRIPPKIVSTSPTDQAQFGEFETIGMIFTAVISEEDTGASWIDWDKSKITLFKNETDISAQLTRLEPEKVNENRGTIKYYISNLSVGTYTMKVEVWDKSKTPRPNGGIQKVITFYVTAEKYIYVKLGDLTYLSIPPMTLATYTTTGSSTLVGTTTITVGTTTDTPTHTGLEVIEPVVKFFFQGSEGKIVFSNDVTLIMHYTDQDANKLQTLGLKEQDLSIYESDGSQWEKDITSRVDEPNNRILLTINKGTELKDKYAIMYSTPPDIVKTFYYSGIKRAELRIKPGTTVNGIPVLADTIVMGTGTDPGKHKNELGLDAIIPMIEFRVNNVVTNLSFSQSVNLWLYYQDNDYATGTDESKLEVYGWDGNNWTRVTGTINTGANSIFIKTNYLAQIIAIMYPVKEVVPTLEAFEQSVCAYPNPAKDGWVKFRYNLARPSQITIKVYTILGDLVWEGNYNDSAGAGITHSWSCVNQAGKKIASGLYIYRITANDGNQEVSVTKKLIVIQ